MAKRDLRLLVLVLLLATLVGILYSRSGVINRAGTYPSHSKRYNLIVQIGADSTVAYSIEDANAHAKYASGNSGSTYQRWFFYWDDVDQLWVHNSDIGAWIWVPTKAGSMQKRSLTRGDPALTKIPPQVRDNLPDSIRTILGI